MMTHHARRLVATGIAVAGLAAGVPSASAATLQVDDDGVQCPAAAFESIQAAVDASGPRDTVLVCNGTYGHVRIAGAEHAGLRLRARVIGGATVVPDGDETAPDGIAVAAGATGVQVSGFVVRRSFTFDDPFQRRGIRVDFGGSTTTIRDNRVIGAFSEHIAITQGATRDITHNRIQGPSATAIDVGGPTVLVADNTIAVPPESGFAAIYVNGSSDAYAGLVVSGNRISGTSAATGIYIEDAFDDRVLFRQNTVSGMGTGIKLNDATGIRVERNVAKRNVVGIQVDASAFRNVLVRNTALGNSQVDCRDEVPFTDPPSPTTPDNSWIANLGRTADPAGICRP